MGNKLGVLIVHGMGMQEEGFEKPLIARLSHKLMKNGLNPEDVVFRGAYWANVVQGYQNKYYEDARRYDLDFLKLRRFVVSALGDATAYRITANGNQEMYGLINKRISESMKSLRDELGEDRPLVIMAHSLGGHIMSCNIWDKQKNPDAETDFENYKTLCGMITFGCNIPLFALAYEEVETIKFPAPELDDDWREKARWMNYYDQDDVLGWPLGAINAYKNLGVEDIAINSGGLLSSWNPMSHSAYWEDNDFVEPAANYIGKLLNN